MEKQKVIKLIKPIIISTLGVTLLILIALQLWFDRIKSLFSIAPFMYWLLLFIIIFLVYFYKIKSKLILAVAFLLYLPASLFVVFGIVSPGEILMRIGFIFWLVGVVLALIEYKKYEKKVNRSTKNSKSS